MSNFIARERTLGSQEIWGRWGPPSLSAGYVPPSNMPLTRWVITPNLVILDQTQGRG